MASADFSPFVVTTASYSVSTADEISPSTTRFFPSIYLPHLLCTVPYSYWTSVCVATLSLCLSLMRFLFVRPKVCLHLPSDSASRRTPLVFGYTLPTVGRVRDFHPLETCAVGHTTIPADRFRSAGVSVFMRALIQEVLMLVCFFSPLRYCLLLLSVRVPEHLQALCLRRIRSRMKDRFRGCRRYRRSSA